MVVDASDFLVMLELPIHQSAFFEVLCQFYLQLLFCLVSVLVLLLALLLAFSVPFLLLWGKHNSQVEACRLLRFQVYRMPGSLVPLKEVSLTRLEGQQDVRLAHDVVNRVLDHLHRSDGSEQEPLSVNGKLSILEAPNFKLVLRADGHDALLTLELVNVLNLLLVNTEAGVDVLNVIDLNKDNGALRKSHDQELFAVLARNGIF